MTTVIKKSYPAPAFDLNEALRYAGAKNDDKALSNAFFSCVEENESAFTYKVCYSEFNIEKNADFINLGFCRTNSTAIAKNLEYASKIILFAATVGIEADRIISRYLKTSPSKAVILNAVASERIEALCNTFCKDIGNEKLLCARFSPGYGDFDISYQKDIFNALNPSKHIGLSLNESLLMTPTKSVTAIIGEME